MIQVVNFPILNVHAGIDSMTLHSWDLAKILHTSFPDKNSGFKKKMLLKTLHQPEQTV